MAQDRYVPDRDRLIAAGLMGAAQRHAGWHDLTAAETAAAVAELRQIAGGRADLLAEVAGILEDASEDEPDEPRARACASPPAPTRP